MGPAGAEFVAGLRLSNREARVLLRLAGRGGGRA
jgi:hypothetical protein